VDGMPSSIALITEPYWLLDLRVSIDLSSSKWKHFRPGWKCIPWRQYKPGCNWLPKALSREKYDQHFDQIWGQKLNLA